MLPGSRCKFCRVRFSEEERAKGLRLHTECIGPYAESFAARQARKRVTKQRQLKALEAREIRERKKALKTIPDLLREAQTAFNQYVRARDEGKPCICCGRHSSGGSSYRGHSWDAGHYRSVGSAPHLRFNEDNVHRQLVVCNRYGAGRAVDYRLGLIERIGLEAVEALEADNRVHKWQRDELIAICDKYRAKLKELKACAT